MVISTPTKDKYDNHLVLALLVIDQSKNYEYFCHKYKTSNSIENSFKNISKNFENLKNNEFFLEKNIKRLIYLSNKEYVKNLLLFSICVNDQKEVLNVKKLLNYINNCEIPKFPISGDYLKKHGYETGEKLGKKLKLLEEKWIDNNFILDEEVLHKSLNKINQN